MAVVATPTIAAPEERVLLENARWETYEALLANYEDCQAPRMAYDHGKLEILMTISESHERFNQTLASAVELVAEEWEIEFVALRSTTYRRKELRLGAEPDSCFYLQNAERIRQVEKIDLSVDPPPDLVIEVQVSRSLVSKLSIWAGLEVPEIWVTNGETIRILCLVGGSYEERARSQALHPLTTDVLEDFLGKSATMPTLAWRKLVREWARNHLPG
jgi:Uma2 family endonuclease